MDLEYVVGNERDGCSNCRLDIYSKCPSWNDYKIDTKFDRDILTVKFENEAHNDDGVFEPVLHENGLVVIMESSDWVAKIDVPTTLDAMTDDELEIVGPELDRVMDIYETQLENGSFRQKGVIDSFTWRTWLKAYLRTLVPESLTLQKISRKFLTFSSDDVISMRMISLLKERFHADRIIVLDREEKDFPMDGWKHVYFAESFHHYMDLFAQPAPILDYSTRCFGEKILLLKEDLWRRWGPIILLSVIKNHTGSIFKLFNFARERLNEMHNLEHFSNMEMFQMGLHPLQLIPLDLFSLLDFCTSSYEDFRGLVMYCLPNRTRSYYSRFWKTGDKTRLIESLKDVGNLRYLDNRLRGTYVGKFYPYSLAYWIRYRNHGIRYDMKDSKFAHLIQIIRDVVYIDDKIMENILRSSNLDEFREDVFSPDLEESWLHLEMLAHMTSSIINFRQLQKLNVERFQKFSMRTD